MPPTPSGATTRYCPRVVPAARGMASTKAEPETPGYGRLPPIMSRRDQKTKAMPGLGTPDPRSVSRSRWTSLPPDVLRGVRKRVAVFALAVAALWALVLFVHSVVAPLIGHHHTPDMGWPWPGMLISTIGLLAAMATWLYDRPNQCHC